MERPQRNNISVDRKIIFITTNGRDMRLIPLYGRDNEDVLYVRIRDEYGETDDAAFDRAERIVSALSKG